MSEYRATEPRKSRKKMGLVALAAGVGLVGAFGGAALFANIAERKAEAKNPFYRVVELSDTTTDPAVWGKNFPLQYDDYLKTTDMVRTRHGGSEALPRTPTPEDPRTVVSISKIEEDPRLKRMWLGYAFAKDFREERGHAFALEDQRYSLRQTVGQPGTCANCHASSYSAAMKLGNGDLTAGFEKLNSMPYFEADKHLTHPVSCVDCHDPQTMELRITRPALMEGMKAYKATQGIQDYDVNRDASRQEMRTLVCAQCHVEYYFKGDKKKLTFPWAKGLQADSMLAYYDEVGFKDWSHKETGANNIKAQHPEFELFMQGTHARAGVACADCHMPFKRAGAMKISDHHVNSPLLKINNACQTCHRVSEQELKGRVEQIQDRHVAIRDNAFDALMNLIDDINAAQKAGAPADRLAQAREYQRKASFLMDFVEAENSVGFHAPQEAARVLSEALNFARLGQLALDGRAPVVKLAQVPATPPKTPEQVAAAEAKAKAAQSNLARTVKPVPARPGEDK